MFINPDQRIGLATIKMGEFNEEAVGQQLAATVTKAQAGAHNGQPGKLAGPYTVLIQVLHKLTARASAPVMPSG